MKLAAPSTAVRNRSCKPMCARPDGNAWTVPVGLQVAKVVKLGPLPVRFALAGQYMVVNPREFGQKWNIQLVIAPVLPKLVRGNLLEPDSLQFGMPKHPPAP